MEVRNSSDLLIVSAYGRGHWLALECARRNWKVTLIDLTSAFGSYAPEDWEGPWGFFDTPELLPSQRSYLIERDQVYPVANGFTCWLSRGPLEMSGPLSQFQMKAAGVSDETMEYLKSIASEPASAAAIEAPRNDRPVWVSNLTLKGLQPPEPLKGLGRVREKIKASKFADAWLAYYAHSFASIAFAENADAMDVGVPMPLHAPYGVRHVTAASIENGFADLEKAGVRVIRANDLYDVRVQSGTFESVVLASGDQVEKARAFSWMLTSTETGKFHHRISSSVYPEGNLKPEWIWTHTRLRLKGVTSAKSLPLAFTILNNVFLPWSHANLLAAKRVRTQDETVPLDIWTRVPARAVGDKDYFEKIGRDVCDLLKSRIPLAEPQVETLPLEADLAPESRHLLRFPIYSSADVRALDTVSAKNLFLAGPEQWLSYDWNTQMRYQAQVLGALERLRAHWENTQRRLEV